MRKGFFLLVFSFFCTTLIGQNVLYTIRDMESFVNSSGDYLMHINDNNSIKGSPYLTEDFISGNVFMDNRWFEDIDLKYDIYNACFEVKFENGVFVLDPNRISADTIEYNDEVFVRKDMDPGNFIRLTYLSLLGQKNGASLFKQYRIRLDNATVTDGYSEPRGAKYVSKSPDYYIFSSNKMWKIKVVKSIAEAFNIETKIVKSYMKENKYKNSNEDDLLEVVKYFSSF